MHVLILFCSYQCDVVPCHSGTYLFLSKWQLFHWECWRSSVVSVLSVNELLFVWHFGIKGIPHVFSFSHPNGVRFSHPCGGMPNPAVIVTGSRSKFPTAKKVHSNLSAFEGSIVFILAYSAYCCRLLCVVCIYIYFIYIPRIYVASLLWGLTSNVHYVQLSDPTLSEA